MNSSNIQTWRGIALLAAGFLTALVTLDLTLGRMYQSDYLREVDDALDDLKLRIPDVLVISSSHGRSFHVLGGELASRTHDAVRLTSVPLEGGKMRNMEWVLENRVAPLIGSTKSAVDVKAPLSKLLVGVTWWDLCRRGTAPEWDANVVSRAWRLEDYAANVFRNGVTNVNRAYATAAWERSLRPSSLVKHRAALSDAAPSIGALVDRVRGQKPVRSTGENKDFLRKWQLDIETGRPCLFAPSEFDALQRLVEFAQRRQLQLTIVLFPLKPATITDFGRHQTLMPFGALMQEFGRRHNVRMVDLTEIPPLGDDDFMADFDHVTAEGNAKFARWALDHDLAFLAQRSGVSPVADRLVQP